MTRRQTAYVKLAPISPKIRKGLSRRARKAIRNAQQKTGKAIEKDLKFLVKSWDTEVKFKVKVSQRCVLTVKTDSDVFKFVDQGTEAHEIFPTQAGNFLRFSSDYRPKTMPGSLRSGKGFRGGKTIKTRFVNHPGIVPRHFCKQLESRYKPRLLYAIQKALRKVWRQSVVGADFSIKLGFTLDEQFIIRPFARANMRVTGATGKTLRMANRIGRRESHPGAYLRRRVYHHVYRGARKRQLWTLYTKIGRRKLKRDIRSNAELNRRASQAVRKHLDPRRRYGRRYTKKW